LKTKQLRPQRRLLGGESVVEGDRIFPLLLEKTNLSCHTPKLQGQVTKLTV